MTPTYTKQTQTPLEPSKKAFSAPVVRKEARVPILTAGSFDLVIPNTPV